MRRCALRGFVQQRRIRYADDTPRAILPRAAGQIHRFTLGGPGATPFNEPGQRLTQVHYLSTSCAARLLHAWKIGIRPRRGNGSSLRTSPRKSRGGSTPMVIPCAFCMSLRPRPRWAHTQPFGLHRRQKDLCCKRAAWARAGGADPLFIVGCWWLRIRFSSACRLLEKVPGERTSQVRPSSDKASVIVPGGHLTSQPRAAEYRFRLTGSRERKFGACAQSGKAISPSVGQNRRGPYLSRPRARRRVALKQLCKGDLNPIRYERLRRPTTRKCRWRRS